MRTYAEHEVPRTHESRHDHVGTTLVASTTDRVTGHFLIELVHTRPAHNALTSVDARFVLPVCVCCRCAWHFNGARARAQLRELRARKGSFAKTLRKSPAAAARGKCAARVQLATLVRPGALYSLQWVCARDPSHYSSSLLSSSSSSTSSKACAASAASTPACAAKTASGYRSFRWARSRRASCTDPESP